jgi:hypothetical protein
MNFLNQDEMKTIKWFCVFYQIIRTYAIDQFAMKIFQIVFAHSIFDFIFQ